MNGEQEHSDHEVGDEPGASPGRYWRNSRVGQPQPLPSPRIRSRIVADDDGAVGVPDLPCRERLDKETDDAAFQNSTRT